MRPMDSTGFFAQISGSQNISTQGVNGAAIFYVWRYLLTPHARQLKSEAERRRGAGREGV